MSNQKAACGCRRPLLAPRPQADNNTSVLGHCHASHANVAENKLARPLIGGSNASPFL